MDSIYVSSRKIEHIWEIEALNKVVVRRWELSMGYSLVYGWRSEKLAEGILDRPKEAVLRVDIISVDSKLGRSIKRSRIVSKGVSFKVRYLETGQN